MKLPGKVDGLDGIRLPEDRELHLAIGMFDGVHRGHQSVIRPAIERARSRGGLAGVLTFWPHPSYLFRPEQPVPQIMIPELKERVLLSLGVDLVIEQPFTPSFAAIPAENFVAHLQKCLPRLCSLSVGENWRFGRGRRGDAALLQRLGREAGLEVLTAPRVSSGERPISSTRIRECLAAGEIAEANAMLGYAYFSEGVVRPGRKLGRTLGFPTLNLPWNPPLKPRFGVYAVRAGRIGGQAADDAALAGVANYGIRPTVDPTPGEPLLEVFLLGGSCPFSAGDRLHVEWLEFLRPERRFPDLGELQRQIREDLERAGRFHRQP